MHKSKVIPRFSTTASYPRTYSAIIKEVPSFLYDRLTAKELAAVVDFAREQYLQGKADNTREIAINKEVYWDNVWFSLSEQ